MMGLETENGRPLLRAYSLVSPNYEETLEFCSIKVPDGPLTSRLQHIREGDRIRFDILLVDIRIADIDHRHPIALLAQFQGLHFRKLVISASIKMT